MAVTKKKRTTSAGSRRVTKQKAVEAIFESYGLPGWLGWGTMGAESTYGTNGSYAFGGIDLPNSGGHPWPIEAQESAKAYAGLVKQYGSLPAAVEHYSGNSYQISHVESLAKGGASQGRETGTARTAHGANGETQLVGLFGTDINPLKISPLYRLFNGEAPLPWTPGEELLPGGSSGGSSPLEKLNPLSGGPIQGIESIEQAGSAITAFLSMLTDVKFWIRVGEAIGAFILIYMGLHALTGVGPTPTTVATTAAASKGL